MSGLRGMGLSLVSVAPIRSEPCDHFRVAGARTLVQLEHFVIY